MNELPTLKEIWKSPEWKAQAKAFSEGKICAWCGAKPGDTYTSRKGKTCKLGFSVHHLEKHKWGLPLYNQVKNKLFREYYRDLKSKPDFKYPIEFSKRTFANRIKFDWFQSNKDEIQANFQKEKERIIKDYMNLTDENAVVLCNKCHYARHKGLILCKKCKKNYHKTKYAQCYECRKSFEDRLNEISN